MKIIFYDINRKLCNELQKKFKDCIDVSIKNSTFEDMEADYIVTSGNSHGLMNGELDSSVRDYYGQKIQDFIQTTIINECKGLLTVGNSILIDTEDLKKKNLIYVPVMENSNNIDKIDILYVFLRILKEYDNQIGDKTLAIPGLGTGYGKIDIKDYVEIMFKGYEIYKNNFIFI